MADDAALGLTIGVTNTRLNAAKRGIAVELALRLASATGGPVCVVGADPTDRDVERRTPGLVAGEPGRTSLRLTRGPHSLGVSVLPARRLCVVSVSDRAAAVAALPELRGIFDIVVIDAPSGVGGGVGIAHVLLESLDALLVASPHAPGDLADTRRYVERVSALPSGRRVAVGVVTSGDPHEAKMSARQLSARLSTLPTVATLPQLWGRGAASHAASALDAAFAPLVGWALDLPFAPAVDVASADAETGVSSTARASAALALGSAG